MNFTRLLLENLSYHRRGNLAVLLGVAVGTAVLTGALLVGDSLHGSMEDLTRKQLAWVDATLVAPRFFRQEAAAHLPAQHVSPVLLLQAIAARENSLQHDVIRIPRTILLGVGPDFWTGEKGTSKGDGTVGGMPESFWARSDSNEASPEGVVLSAALARDLGAAFGDSVSFSLEQSGGAPHESLMGQRTAAEVINTFKFTVKAILPAGDFGSVFSLNPSSAPPRNAFVPLAVLQNQLYQQQQEKKAHRRFPKSPVNLCLLRGADEQALRIELKKSMTLLDWGLELRVPERKFKIDPPGYFGLESREMFVPAVAQQAVADAGLRSAKTLVYLVNNMAALKHEYGALGLSLAPPGGAGITRPLLQEFAPVQVPYCIVAALDPGLQEPLGPFLPKGVTHLDDEEILLVNWPESPLANLKPYESYVALNYYDPDTEGQLREKTTLFTLAGHVDIKGPTNDLYLTPDFPGITDSKSLTQAGGWDPPFPFKRWLISEADEIFWREHRTTPKAYITLKKGQKIWGSRFGDVTSIRIAPEGRSPKDIEQMILARLDPEQGGYRVINLRAANLAASSGTQRFGMLFLGFSAFLIVAALLLIALLFRLNLDLRAREIGLLLAVGLRRRTVRRLLLAEGALLALTGGLAGTLLALGYARLLLDYLAAQWPGGLDRSLFLHLHISPWSVLVGYASAVLAGVLTIFLVTHLLARVQPRALLAGETREKEKGKRKKEKAGAWTYLLNLLSFVPLLLVVLGILGAAVCFYLGTILRDHELQATSFLGSGALLLTAGLAALWLWLHRRQGQMVTRGGIVGLARLGMRNAARQPVRSLLTSGLLASATFLIVAVQSFHRDPARDFLEKAGGSGGFTLLAETEVPIFENLNAKADLARFARSDSVRSLIQSATFVPFRVRQGDDVSCLNLYKPREPRLLGVPATLIQRGGFQFAEAEPLREEETEALGEEEKDNPWLLLDRELDDGVIPVFGEANTVTWILGSKLGGEIQTTDEAGRTVRLRIVGLLQDSVFQSELLMSERNLQKVYPRLEGFRFFLIGGPKDHLTEVKIALEQALADYGMVVTPSRERLATYLAVENTYLATFQALGGLGLLLGALGLAVVLLRSVWERRGELALLRALGFRRSALGWLVLAENLYLLIAGLAIGVVAALVSVEPHLAGGEVPWLALTGLLLIVVLVGLLAGLGAVRATLRAPLLFALRKE